MKRLTLALLALVCAFGFANAQERPDAGSIGLGFRVTGLANVMFSNWQSTGLSGASVNDQLGVFPAGTTVDDLVPQNMLFGRYYLSSDLAVRAGLGINSYSSTIMSVDSVGGGSTALTTTEDNISAFSFGIAVGIEKHMATSASRLDPYVGAQIDFSLLGGISEEMTSNTNTDPAISVDMTRDWDGGSAFGVNVLGGFNYFFSDMAAIGAEVTWGFNRVGIGGEYIENTQTTVGGTTTTTQTRGEFEQSMGGLSVGSTAGVNFSIFW